MFMTSSWCSIRLYSGQNGRCINVIFKNSEVRMSRCLDMSAKTQMAKIMVQYGRSSRSSRKEFVRSSSGRTIMGKATWGSSIGTRLGKIFKLGMDFCQPGKRTVLMCVDDITLAGKTENIETDLEISVEKRWFGRTNTIPRPIEIVANCRDMFESRISAGAKEKLNTRASGKPDAETISSWSYDMEGHAKKWVERYCELANKTTQQFYKVATPCMDDHQFEEEENESVGELSTVCSQFVIKCMYLARVGRPDTLWSVNKLARAGT